MHELSLEQADAETSSLWRVGAYSSFFLLILFVMCCVRVRVARRRPERRLDSNNLNGPYREIGQGAFGSVYKCRYNGENVVIKLFSGADANNNLRHEQDRLRLLGSDHRNVVTHKGLVALQSGQIYTPSFWRFWSSPNPRVRTNGLVFEYANQGDLHSFIRSRRLTFSSLLNLARDITHGLAFLHGQNIIHQDLKPENILICDGVAKIADLGIARARRYRTTVNGRTITMGTAEADFVPGGTLIYLAPEVLALGARCTSKSDIFSLGIIFWELANPGRNRPVRSVGEIERGVFFNRHNGPIESTPFDNLIPECVKVDPDERPNASGVLQQLRS